MIKIKFNKSINGFQNELEIKRELDNKTIKELNPMYRSFIEDLFSNINDSDLINCIIEHLYFIYSISL